MTASQVQVNGPATLMHVALRCADLPAALAFYRDGLGFTRTYGWDRVTSAAGVTTYRGRALYLDLGGHTYLELFDGGPDEPDPERSPVHHLALLVADVDGAYRKCLDAGGRACPVDSWDGRPTTVELNGAPPMTVRIAFIAGPSGELIELYEQLTPVRTS